MFPAEADANPPVDGQAVDPPFPGKPAEELLPLVYAQLRSAAQFLMAGERTGHTLQPTALVSEAYARLSQDLGARWPGTREFYLAAAQAMRRILIEHARRRGRIKRGGDWTRVALDSVDVESAEDCGRVLALDEAIGRLEKEDARAAEVVCLRFFAGLTVDQTAAALSQSRRTVLRDWEFARAWLLDDLRLRSATGE
jgi:RNA polymerase sigma factor (TIGR02999 family)